ncbi:MAG: (2Fe-2S)-binding protein [Aridibacter famidurans]|nr:(2Fe-2S)-binding protein [Aridibacter famidurans]
MKEVLITFEEQGLEGIVAVDTYLLDAAKRLGVDLDDRCRRGEEEHRCSLIVGDGGGLLSEATKIEIDLISEAERKKGKRLACQAKVFKPGEVKIMSVEKTEEARKAEEEPKTEEEFKKEFEELPLEQKYAKLLELEAIALGETFSFVINSPYEAAGKVMDALANFGWKKDREDHEAKKPEEHSEKKEKEAADGTAGKHQPKAEKNSSTNKDAGEGKAED